jgi:hypothetical protein
MLAREYDRMAVEVFHIIEVSCIIPRLERNLTPCPCRACLFLSEFLILDPSADQLVRDAWRRRLWQKSRNDLLYVMIPRNFFYVFALGCRLFIHIDFLSLSYRVGPSLGDGKLALSTPHPTTTVFRRC